MTAETIPEPRVAERRTIGRRASAAIGVAFARLRSRPGRNLLLVGGIAAATALFAAVLGGTTIARDRSLQRLVRGLPASDRGFRVDLVGLPGGEDRKRNGTAARNELLQLTGVAPARALAFRDFYIDGQLVRLGGIDGLGRVVRLRSGRLPRRCDADVCEVLQIGTTGKPQLDDVDLHFTRVGIADLRDPAAYGPAFLHRRQLRAQASYVTAVLLLAPSVAAIDRLPALQLISRLESWAVPLDAARVHAWEIPSLLRRESLAQARLEQVDSSFLLVGPDTALVEAKARGDVYGQRMALLGGSVAVALFGFALVAAVGLRRGLAAERRRLAQRGATRWQVATATLTEVGVLAVSGWLIGVACGALAVGIAAGAAEVPVTDALRHSLLTREAAVSLVAGLVLGLLVLAIVVSTEDATATRRSRIRLLDVAALGAVVAIAVGVSRGALDAGAGSSTGDRTFLLLLPALVCVVGGLLAARLLGPLMMLAERLARRASVAIRLALLALARAPARTTAAGAFLVVTIGLVVFAGAYRATLDRGLRDEAAFAVPLDVSLMSGSSLRQPIDVAGAQGYAHLAPGVRPYPVLRATATAVGTGTSVQSPTVLGVPSDALAAMQWRSDYAETSRSTLVERLRPSRDMSLRGVAIPDDTVALQLSARVRGAPLALDLVVEDERGRIDRLPLTKTSAYLLAARMPAVGSASRPRRVVALGLQLSKAGRAWLLHLARENRVQRVPAGTLSIGDLQSVDTKGAAAPLTNWQGWIARGRRATVAGRKAGALQVSYVFPEVASLYLRPRQPTDAGPVPVVVSPAVAQGAGPDGLLTLDLYDSQVRSKVVGVARRFPTLGEDEEFVVGDERTLSTAMDADAPGTGTPGELWLAAPREQAGTVERALSQPPFSQLQHSSRRTLYERAHADPLSRGIETMLGAAALLALVLALIGLWASLLSDLRDERDTFFDLEAQGAGPETLRRHLRIRALALLAFGLAGGLLLGLVLSRLVVSVVHVTGAATEPFPPLVLDAGFGTVAVALAALIGATALAVELTVRRAFRAPSPERASWSLE